MDGRTDGHFLFEIPSMGGQNMLKAQGYTALVCGSTNMAFAKGGEVGVFFYYYKLILLQSSLKCIFKLKPKSCGWAIKILASSVFEFRIFIFY